MASFTSAEQCDVRGIAGAERLDELIYLSLLNADHLPGPQTSRLTPQLYAQVEESGPAISRSPGTAQKQTVATVTKGQIEDDILIIGRDGKTMWLCFSANFSPGWNNVALKFNPPGGRYGLCLHEVKLLGPGDETPQPLPNLLRSPANLAPAAKVEASSVHDGYRADVLTELDLTAAGTPARLGPDRRRHIESPEP